MLSRLARDLPLRLCRQLTVVIAMLFITLLPTDQVAEAQTMPRCTTRADMLAYLAKTHGERPVAIGLTSNGVLMEVLAHPDGRSCSVLSTALQGGVRVSCLQLAGEAFRMLPAQSERREDPPS